MVKVTGHDRKLIAVHVEQLKRLAATHREFAAIAPSRSQNDCVLTRSDAVAAAKRVERLIAIISSLVAAA